MSEEELQPGELEHMLGDEWRRWGQEIMAGARTDFERGLIAAAREYCKGFAERPNDRETEGAIWFVVNALRVWEESGAKEAVEAMQTAWKRSEATRVQRI